MQSPHDSSHNYAVIMAGGSGTRLWPLSRKDLPKQMQKFISDKTLINETVERLTGSIPKDHIFITTTTNYAEKIMELLPDIPSDNITIEPIARGTTAALALVTTKIHQKDPEASIFYLASDHAVTDVEAFQKTIQETFHYVSEHTQEIALIGIKPTRPDTGLGYIKMKKMISSDPLIYTVDKFVEKPSREVAQKYVNSGEYFWNAAYYCFKAATLLEAYLDADHTIIDSINAYLATGDIDEFMKIPDKVHEIEIINPSHYKLVLVPAEFEWSDIGNWRTLHEVLSQLQGDTLVSNASQHVDFGSKDCLIVSTQNKLVATVGLENIVIVDTPDILLVLNKDRPQEIKDLLENIKANNLTEYL